ncbi:hypothetical protein SAMN04489806_0465 [Paramicrobacterium humi]|uniref:Tfp pilus assembly protein PilN n=1 Tax=Paramicrobacterium humi TaxID=640635 RepID=A0A1H4J595_9MICO|nr:hypothetical protein [Microbacterium humi]SEB40742.1 hypothetical protein SAMN04489806_0465 [Microbacterium humi]
MSAAENIIVGTIPRADLMPPEIKAAHTHRIVRNRVITGVIATVVVTALAVSGLFALQVVTAANLVAEQQRTTDLLLEQQKYSEVREIKQEAATVEAGQRVGAATEIDWKAYLDAVQKTLPADVAITDVQIEAASPLVDYAQADTPLQGQRVAELAFTAVSSTVPDVSAWLNGLSTLTGFTDASPDSTKLDDETGTYSVTITMHVNDEAWSGRFEDKKPEKKGE